MANAEYQSVLDGLIGQNIGWHKIEYNWRDVALYNMAVGAGADGDENDLDYYYEKNLKVIPTFGAIPNFTAINNEPQTPTPYPAFEIVRSAISRKYDGAYIRMMDYDQEVLFHRPIDAIKGSMVYNSYWDRGGKGSVVKCTTPVYDEAGVLTCTNIGTVLVRDYGELERDQYPKSPVEYPDRKPDFVKEGQFSHIQAALFRLAGDTNYVHIDPDWSKRSNNSRPYMMGFCSIGFGYRMAIEAVIPG